MVLEAKSCNSPLTCLIWSVGMLICCMLPSKVFHALVESFNSPTIDFMPLPRAVIPPMIAPPTKLAPRTDLKTEPTLPAEPFSPSSELLIRCAPLSASLPSKSALIVTVPSAIDYSLLSKILLRILLPPLFPHKGAHSPFEVCAFLPYIPQNRPFAVSTYGF